MNDEVTVETWNSSSSNKNRVFAAVFAHSDDLAILAGGLTMKLLAEGYTGYFIKTTNDEMDSYDLSMAETVYRLYNETIEVTEFLGLKKMFSLDYKNHYLDHGQLSEIRHRLITLFRFLQVDTVISFDPWGHYEENPDHYITGHAVEQACWMAGRHLDLPELQEIGLKPKFVTRKYLVARGPQLINRVVDITPVIEKKFAAIKIHRTPLDNMLRTHRDLHPGIEIDEDSYIRREFLKEADPKYGVKYVESYHFIDEYSSEIR